MGPATASQSAQPRAEAMWRGTSAARPLRASRFTARAVSATVATMADQGLPTMRRFTPGPDTTREFRDALGHFATGVTVVTCASTRGPLGMTANSFTSLSLDPPLVLWAPARSSRRFAAFAEAERFAIHVLADDQDDLARRFTQSGHHFDGIGWQADGDGVPLIERCAARFECTRHAVFDGGDHAIVVGRVTHASHSDGAPLLFAKGRYGRFTAGG